MEVSQQSDSITHAVIGKKESVEMGVSDSATLMHVLSTALYTHPQLAAAREIICNGWDGHIISGNTDKPLQITIDEQFIKIRDFGPGIPHEKIGQIYGTYGNSTKRHDGQQTGGFGLGSKAPFAYTDNFEVINHHGGEKIVYRVSKSSMAAGGKPSIDTIVRVPSTETGIQVSMNIKSHYDKGKFMEFVQEVALLGEIKVSINEQPVSDMLPLSESPTGYIINSADGTLLSRINLRYGNVVYPVPRHEFYGEVWDQVHNVLIRLWEQANVIFMAPANQITIAPSREALIFTEGTLNTVKNLLAKFNPESAKSSPVTARQVSATQINKIIPTEKHLHLPGDLSREITLTAQRGTSAIIAGGPYNFDARKAAVSFAISRRSLRFESDKLTLKRLKNAIYHGNVDKTMGKIFMKACHNYLGFTSGKNRHSLGVTADSYLRKALHKHMTWPLMQTIKAHVFMDLDSMHYTEQRWSAGEARLVNPWKINIGNIDNLIGHLTPRILLARSKKAITEFLSNRRHKEPRANTAGWMVYQLPKSDKHYDDIKAVFEGLGYQVHTYLPVTERVERTKKSDDPNWVPAPKKAAIKRKGYLTLHSSRAGNEFLLSTARARCKPEDHVVDPIAYVILNSSTDFYKKRFSTINDAEVCRLICDIFGKQIAVITTTQVEKIEKLGVPELSKFIYQHVDDTLAASKDFPRYLAFGRHVATDHNHPEGANGILQGLTQHHDLAASLPGKFRFCVSAETLSMARFIGVRGFREMGTPKCDELSKKIPVSKEVKKLLDRVRKSPWAIYVDLDQVGKALHMKAPNDPALAVPYEIVTHLMTPVETQQ